MREARRVPTPEHDGTATWSRTLLRKVLRASPDGLPRVPTYTIRRTLHEAGHKSVALVSWLFAHGIMPLDTPVSGSWLNMAESIQRVLKRRALAGPIPTRPAEIMKWFAEVAGHWNADPTPFVWGGKRAVRRKRQRDREHRIGGSGATARRPIGRRKSHGRRKWPTSGHRGRSHRSRTDVTNRRGRLTDFECSEFLAGTVMPPLRRGRQVLLAAKKCRVLGRFVERK